MAKPSLAPVFVAAALLVSSAAAQGADAPLREPPTTRQGYYVALDLGMTSSAGWERKHDDGRGPFLGGGGALRLGQMLTPRFGLGLQFEGGGGSRGERRVGGGGLGFDGQWRPMERLALRGMLGLGVQSISKPSDPDDEAIAAFGAAFGVGASYDWSVWSFDPSGGWTVGPQVQVKMVHSKSVLVWQGQAGLEVSWWSGLDRNELELTEDQAYRRD